MTHTHTHFTHTSHTLHTMQKALEDITEARSELADQPTACLLPGDMEKKLSELMVCVCVFVIF